MTEEQVTRLNALLHEPARRFTAREKEFLIVLSTKLRYIILSRLECMALQEMADRLIDAGPTRDPGPVDSFDGYDVRPEPETEHEGGPGGTRPPGTGDGNDVPDKNAMIRRYGEEVEAVTGEKSSVERGHAG